MKREIKFRIWNGREMEYNITSGKFGTFYVNPEGGNGLDPKDSASLSPNTTKYHEDTPVMQFTGLKDKNNKDIYEGDVLQNPQKLTGIVVFYEGGFYLEAKRRNKDLWYMPLTKGMLLNKSIVGNIYENPELLNQ